MISETCDMLFSASQYISRVAVVLQKRQSSTVRSRTCSMSALKPVGISRNRCGEAKTIRVAATRNEETKQRQQLEKEADQKA